ncbi:MAG TPA: hypothetical protein PLZ12_16140 [Saprospiraceae bacterium]|nr:hypothetical protein [Saprospiraceae bacterium]
MNTKSPFRRLFLLLSCLWAGTLAAQPGPDCNWMTGFIPPIMQKRVRP